MFYLKHKTTGKYFNYDDNGDIYWMDTVASAYGWHRECDALFVQNIWEDDTVLDFCLWQITYIVEE